MWVLRSVGYGYGQVALVFLSIPLLLFIVPTVTSSQEKYPAYLTPPGNEYPQPAHGAQPPIIYNPCEWNFESREALELEKGKPPVKTNEEKEEYQEEAKSDEIKLLEVLPPRYWPFEELDSDKPQGERIPWPSDPQELGKGSWVSP